MRISARLVRVYAIPRTRDEIKEEDIVKQDVSRVYSPKHPTPDPRPHHDRTHPASTCRAHYALLIALIITLSAAPTRAQDAEPDAPTIFPRMRALDLGTVRALALERSTAIALSTSKLAQAQAELREQRDRFKVSTAGGLDPFTGKVRFYLSLDLERLLQLNKQQRIAAQQGVEAQAIGQTDARNGAIKGVTVAWYGLRRAETAVTAAARYRETAQAIYVAADARFKAGQGELTGVLSGLRGTWQSEDAYTSARQDVALACLDLAQACGYATAEEMEAAL